MDVEQVGRELGVRYVVEGSIRKGGVRVRVTAQLIDAATGNHLWAERYDRTLEDVFAVQEEVTRSIVSAIAPEVELVEVAHACRANPNDTAARLALAMASYTAREYAESMRWAQLAIQSQPAAPIRRTIVIACCARAGDLQQAAQERAVLDGFAPEFIASVFRGENRVFTRPEDMEHLLEGLRLVPGEQI